MTLAGTALALVGAAAVIDVFGGLRLSPVGLAWAAVSLAGNTAFFLFAERSADTVSPIVLLATGMTFGGMLVCAPAAVGALSAQRLRDRAGVRARRGRAALVCRARPAGRGEHRGRVPARPRGW